LALPLVADSVVSGGDTPAFSQPSRSFWNAL